MFGSLLQDAWGQSSSKRMICLGAFLCLFVLVVASLYGHAIEKTLVSTLGQIIMTCVAAITSERFSGKLNPPPPDTSPPTEPFEGKP